MIDIHAVEAMSNTDIAGVAVVSALAITTLMGILNIRIPILSDLILSAGAVAAYITFFGCWAFGSPLPSGKYGCCGL